MSPYLCSQVNSDQRVPIAPFIALSVPVESGAHTPPSDRIGGIAPTTYDRATVYSDFMNEVYSASRARAFRSIPSWVLLLLDSFPKCSPWRTTIILRGLCPTLFLPIFSHCLRSLFRAVSRTTCGVTARGGMSKNSPSQNTTSRSAIQSST